MLKKKFATLEYFAHIVQSLDIFQTLNLVVHKMHPDWADFIKTILLILFLALTIVYSLVDEHLQS